MRRSCFCERANLRDVLRSVSLQPFLTFLTIEQVGETLNWAAERIRSSRTEQGLISRSDASASVHDRTRVLSLGECRLYMTRLERGVIPDHSRPRLFFRPGRSCYSGCWTVLLTMTRVQLSVCLHISASSTRSSCLCPSRSPNHLSTFHSDRADVGTQIEGMTPLGFEDKLGTTRGQKGCVVRSCR